MCGDMNQVVDGTLRLGSSGDGLRAPKLASPPVATRNGLALLLLGSAILTHEFCYRAQNFWRNSTFRFSPGSSCPSAGTR
jgi:hypothetical protein